MSLINEIADMIAKVRGHDRAKCNEKCECYPLALEIVALFERTYAADRNRLSEMLYERTNKLQSLQRLVGEEEQPGARIMREGMYRDPDLDRILAEGVEDLYED